MKNNTTIVTIFVTAILGILAFNASVAQDSEVSWSTDFEAAKAKAKAEKKLLLLDFTGSDWCGWCIKLHNEVFSKPEFQKYAAENLILVELDFPSKKAIAPKTKAQNEKLRDQFGVRGYPTVLLLNPDGTVLAKTGYQKGGPKTYVKHLKKLIKKAE